MAIQNEYYVGKGTAYLEKIGSDDGLLPIGNATALNLAFATSKLEMADNENAGGGVADSIVRIDGVTASATIANLNAVNLARATAGISDTEAGASVGSEEHKAGASGSLIKFDKVPDTNSQITVTSKSLELDEWAASTAYAQGDLIKDGGDYYEATVAGTSGSVKPTFNKAETGDTTTDDGVTWTYRGALPALVTYVDGTDYEIRNGGIVLLDGNIAKGSDVLISYTSLEFDIIEALTSVGTEYRLVFDGLNEANSGKPFLITAHRVKLSPTSSLPVIADDYATIDIEIDILKDDSVGGTGKSKYVKIEKAAR